MTDIYTARVLARHARQRKRRRREEIKATVIIGGLFLASLTPLIIDEFFL